MFGAPATHFIHIMRGMRRDAGTTTNKDLDTGGYTAKTCEAYAAMTGGKESQAKREAVPPQAGHGNMKMTTSAIGCSMCHRTFNSRYWSFQMLGWVGVQTNCRSISRTGNATS